MPPFSPAGPSPKPPAIYTGAAALEDTVPVLISECPLTVLDTPARPRLWLGNTVTAATHYDNSDGINCIVAGRKRFTLFPPEQFRNLYIGPLELGPGGQPTSLVRVKAPDLARYPRYSEALAAAEAAEVEPGDAIYIPNLRWHNVESLEAVNLSVNFWWFDAGEWAAEPFAALAHTLLALHGLPQSRREVWRKMFEHYAFRTEGEPLPYLPMARRGILGTLSAKIQEYMRVQVIRSLTQRMSPQLGEGIRRLLWEARARGEGR